MNHELRDKEINILGVEINTLNKDQVVNKIDQFLLSQNKHYIVTPNPEFLMVAQKDQEFKNILNKADLAVPDGIGLLWASSLIRSKIKDLFFIDRFPGRRQRSTRIKVYLKSIFYGLMLILYPKYCQKVISERITGTDLIFDIAKLCEQKKCSIFLLGAKEGVAEVCALKLFKKYPNLKISGTYSGNPEQKYDKHIVDILNNTKTDVLLVAYGHPKQEKWISRNLSKLENIKVAIGVGGAFDFISGKVKRAPKIFRRLDLEWFYRVIRQPQRFNRILTATWQFSNEVIEYKLKETWKDADRNAN